MDNKFYNAQKDKYKEKNNPQAGKVSATTSSNFSSHGGG